MTSIAEALAAAVNVHTGAKCGLCTLIATADPVDSTAILAAIDNHDLAATTVARAISSAGVTVKADVINRHRRGECATA